MYDGTEKACAIPDKEDMPRWLSKSHIVNNIANVLYRALETERVKDLETPDQLELSDHHIRKCTFEKIDFLPHVRHMSMERHLYHIRMGRRDFWLEEDPVRDRWKVYTPDSNSLLTDASFKDENVDFYISNDVLDNIRREPPISLADEIREWHNKQK